MKNLRKLSIFFYSFPILYSVITLGIDSPFMIENSEGSSVLTDNLNNDANAFIDAVKTENYNKIRQLVEENKDINATNSDGQTALHIAVEQKSVNTVKLILNFPQTDPNVADAFGITPLHIACKNVQADARKQNAEDESTPEFIIAKTLIEDERINFDVKDKAELTPLNILTYIGYYRLIKLMVNKKANLDLKTYTTPLCIAAEAGQLKITKLLLKNNAKVSAQDHKGFTPLHYACKNNDLEMAKLLMRYGASTSIETFDTHQKPYQLTENIDVKNIALGRETSDTHPLEVDYIECELLGSAKIGITMCPGRNKKNHSRNLNKDIDILLKHGCEVLVTLVQQSELDSMGIPHFVETVTLHGMEVIHSPIKDKWIPNSMDYFMNLIEELVEQVALGKNIVVHCNGGRGRSGLVVVSTLVALGLEPGKATDIVRSSRARMLYNPAQILYVKVFKVSYRSKKSKKKGEELTIETLPQPEEVEDTGNILENEDEVKI